MTTKQNTTTGTGAKPFQNDFTDAWKEIIELQMKQFAGAFDQTLKLGKSYTSFYQNQIKETAALNQQSIDACMNVSEQYRNTFQELVERGIKLH